LDNVRIADVTNEDYLSAIELMDETKLDPNDSLAVQVMRKEEIEEIYSFDKGFDRIRGIRRIT